MVALYYNLHNGESRIKSLFSRMEPGIVADSISSIDCQRNNIRHNISGVY